jgi:hypothetical protein
VIRSMGTWSTELMLRESKHFNLRQSIASDHALAALPQARRPNDGRASLR